MKFQKPQPALAGIAVLIMLTTAGCSSAANQAVETGQIPSQSPSSGEIGAICGTVAELRQGWFSGESMDDFTKHIPILAAQLATIQGRDEAGVIVTSKVLLEDLLLIQRFISSAPTTERESADFSAALDNFPLRSETVVNLCE